jgi:hypothetical protein
MAGIGESMFAREPTRIGEKEKRRKVDRGCFEYQKPEQTRWLSGVEATLP